MIVPRSRLLLWFAMIVVPAALFAGVVPRAIPAGFIVIAGFAGVVIADAISAPRRLSGLAIQLPPVVRLSKDRDGKIDLRIRNDCPRKDPLRLALDLPPAVRPETEELDVMLPGDSQWSRVVWNCVPAVRGNFRIGAVYAGSNSPFGFWFARKMIATQSEIRVYPNLLTERKSLAALFLKRGTFGLHLQRQVGKGRDFEKLREYVSGDSFDEIHWKATARRARPITKVFQIERTQEIYAVVDASRLSGRPVDSANPGSILERYVTAALVLGLAAEQQGDLFGLVSFTDKVEAYVPARNGKSHYGVCRDALYTLQPKTVSPDFDEVCAFLRLRLRRRALIIFLTSLDDPALADSFVRNIELVRRLHLVVVHMIRQPGTAVMFSDPNPGSVDDLYRHLGGHLRWHKLSQLGKALRRHGILFSLIENERFSADAVSQYLAVKQRQLI